MPRADDIRMDDQEIRAYLEGGHTIILVSQGPRGFPHAMPMFYSIDQELNIYFATYASSQKVRNIERDAKVTLLLESGSAYSELKGTMIEGIATISTDLDRTVQTMIAGMENTGTQLPSVEGLSEEVKRRMAGKRVLVTVKPQRFVSWDHGKLPQDKTPDAL